MIHSLRTSQSTGSQTRLKLLKQERIAEADNALESIIHSLGRHIGKRKSAVALLLKFSNCKSVLVSIGKVQACILLLVTMSSHDDNKAAKDARDVLDNISFSDDNVILMAKANYFKYVLIATSFFRMAPKSTKGKGVAGASSSERSKKILDVEHPLNEHAQIMCKVGPAFAEPVDDDVPAEEEVMRRYGSEDEDADDYDEGADLDAMAGDEEDDVVDIDAEGDDPDLMD